MGVSIIKGKFRLQRWSTHPTVKPSVVAPDVVQPAEVALRLIGASTLLPDNKSVIEIQSAGLSRPQDAVLSLVRINRARLVRLSVMQR